ncbi:MAG: hypothetical protein GX638_05355 [Crenarchaeota archaeon]|nr:hypothetical protein [Thermoproteota archaeon]
MKKPKIFVTVLLISLFFILLISGSIEAKNLENSKNKNSAQIRTPILKQNNADTLLIIDSNAIRSLKENTSFSFSNSLITIQEVTSPSMPALAEFVILVTISALIGAVLSYFFITRKNEEKRHKNF